ncbi:MAG: hypothetical protein QGH83_09745 [Candidatus Pacebacteria bacterium]|nr:hypothetical protein [Candidatus Paceibacterota bacterium]
MPITATITTNDPIQGTTTTPAEVAASTSVGVQPQITRMEIPGIKGADGDISWAGTWSSTTTYTENQAVQYNGSAYVCLQGNSDIIPSDNTNAWSLMVSKGDIGATGIAGDDGDAGATGATGPAGVQGASGPSGATGQQGPTGATGATGDTGIAASIALGSVSTGVAGSSASISNSGSSTAAVFNFTIPTGSNGATGQTGAAGADGATGADGDDGATGPTGATGPSGTNGTNGTNGAAGAAATIAVGTVSTGLPGSNVSVTNSGSTAAASLDFAIPRGATGATGEITWKGGWSSATAYGTNEAVYYSGSSYIAIINNQNVTPGTDTAKWNIMAQAGAEGGSISSMSDTVISANPSDNSIIMYQNSSTKWKDQAPFGNTYGDVSINGGTF